MLIGKRDKSHVKPIIHVEHETVSSKMKHVNVSSFEMVVCVDGFITCNYDKSFT